MFFVFFFFQAEDGIRDLTVTGVQTCALPISSNRGDDSGGGVYAADPAVVGVGDEEVPVRVQDHSRRMVQRSSGGGAAIPAEGKSTIAGDSGNDSGRSIDAADAPVLRVGDKEIAVCVKGNFAREIQTGAGSRTAVAAITSA